MHLYSSNATTAHFNNALPGDEPASAASSTHSVEQGDTLTALARRYGVNLSDLITANPQIINPDLIYPGDTLLVPQGQDQPVGTGPNESDAPAANNTKLNRGARGPEVSQLQSQLQILGYYDGEIGGNFGPLTEAGVRAFQQDNGLIVDGWAGPDTLSALAANPSPSSAGAGVITAPDTPVVASGARAERIEAAIDYGMSVIGAPYGGATPFRFGDIPWDGGRHVSGTTGTVYQFPEGTQVFDCSGLIVSMFKRAGIDMGYSGTNLTSSRSVVNNAGGHLQDVSRDQLQRGDLIAYPGHIVIYLGDGKILEASPPNVQVASADKYWNRSDVVFRRVPF